MWAMRLLRLAILGSVLIGAGTQAFAQAGPAAPPVVPPTCDEGFNNVLNSRAWLETQREMEAAQKFILKPDSVLEYSCFNNILERVSDRTATAQFLAPSRAGIESTVLSPLTVHLGSNFSHTLGGGLAGASPGGTCAAMYAIWDLLKCQDFDKADFRFFSDIGADDRRSLPVACPDAGRTAKWAAQLAAAYPAPVPAAAPGSGKMDAEKTYLDRLDPETCDSFPPVYTGIRVIGNAGSAYDDAVCVAPGCYYDKTAECQ